MSNSSVESTVCMRYVISFDVAVPDQQYANMQISKELMRLWLPTISMRIKIVKESITVTPNDILSPDSGGSKNTSRVSIAIIMQGRIKFIT